MAVGYSKKIAEVIENFFDMNKMDFEPVNYKGVIKANIVMNNNLKDVDMSVDVTSDGFTITSVLQVSADSRNINKIAEFMARANYGMRYGSFEVDYRDGEISYRTSCYCGENAVPALDVVRLYVATAIVMLQKYGNALVDVLFGISTPKKAIEDAEKY